MNRFPPPPSKYSSAARSIVNNVGVGVGAVFLLGFPIRRALPAPVVTIHPQSHTASAGASVVFATAADGMEIAYQWRKNGVAIAGATDPILVLNNVQPGDAGTYDVLVTNADASIESRPATLAIAGGGGTSHLANVSVRANLDANRTLIVGFAVSGGHKPLLVRAVGPGLQPYLPAGVNFAADPRLELYDAASVAVNANDNWSSDGSAKQQALADAMAIVGAFPLPGNSLDAALISETEGPNTVHARVTAPGLGLVEAYDTGSDSVGRLVNVSARYAVGSGDGALIAGFVVEGAVSTTLLIRGIGPELATFGVADALANPRIEVFNAAQQKVAENDDWTPALALAFTQVGAFPLMPGSADAASLVTLAPGSYTAVLSGAGGTTGEGLVEVYEMP